MLTINTTESTPGPEARRPGFLSHSVHHSTSPEVITPCWWVYCLPYGLQIKLLFEVEAEMGQHPAKVWSLQPCLFWAYRGVQRLRNSELTSVSRLALVLLSPPEPRWYDSLSQGPAPRNEGQNKHGDLLHEEKHRPPGPPNPEKVQQCRESTGEQNSGEPFPMVPAGGHLQLLREESSLSPQMHFLFSTTVTNTTVWNSSRLEIFLSSIWSCKPQRHGRQGCKRVHNGVQKV